MNVTVVIPAHNRASVISRAILSVKSRKTSYEIIVVDDGSNDHTCDVVRTLADHNCKLIRIPSKTNSNCARNKAIRQARGRIIAFLDSDDEWHGDRLDKMIDYFEAHDPDILVDNFATRRKDHFTCFEYTDCSLSNDLLRKALAYHAIPLTFSSISAKRVTLQAIGLLDEHTIRHQDRDFLLSGLADGRLIHLRNPSDVMKHQSEDSFSRIPDNYISSLEHITSKHNLYSSSQDLPVKQYLVMRSLISSLLRLQLNSLKTNYARYIVSPGLLSGGPLRMRNYPTGKANRRRLEKRIIQRSKYFHI